MSYLVKRGKENDRSFEKASDSDINLTLTPRERELKPYTSPPFSHKVDDSFFMNATLGHIGKGFINSDNKKDEK